MGDIGSGFFTLPDISIIHKTPKEVYDLPTYGLLHSAKFSKLLDFLLESQEDDSIYDIFEGHALQEILGSMKLKQIADFSRHVLHINKNNIGWQVVDEYLAELDKTWGKPAWKRPDFIFSEDFNHIFTNMIKWDINSNIQNLMHDYINESDVIYLSKQRLLDNMSRNYQFWNIKDLFLLIEGLVELKPMKPDIPYKYESLLIALSQLILEQIKNRNQEVEKRVVFLTIFSKSLLQLGDNKVQEIQEIVNRLWIEIENTYQDNDLSAYRYIFSVIYAHIGYNYYKEDLGFIHKREFLDRILSSFFSFTDINIREWLDNFVNSEVENLVLALILDGYLQIVNLLDNYAKEIPVSSTFNDLVDQINQITDALGHTAEDYLKSLLDIEVVDYTTIKKLENKDILNGEKYHILLSILKIICRCFELKILYQPDVVIEEKEIIRIGKLRAFIAGEALSLLFTNYLLLMTNKYKFDDYLYQIEYEADETGSIVSSGTFEKEILFVTSQTMEVIKKQETMGGKDTISEMEKLLVFVSEWLLAFKSKSQYYQDALMIFSPLISIIYVKIVQAYHQQNKGILSFLVFLTMQHFSIIIKDEIDLVGTMDKEKTLSYLANDFEEMIADWDIKEFSNIDGIVENIKLITVNQIPANSTMGGMLDDELLMGFLERTTALEKALEIGNKTSNLLNMHQYLYREPLNGRHPFERIGLYKEDILEFPLIRNYLMYNAAISVIPMELNISQSLRTMDTKGLVVYFFKENNQLD